MISSNRLLASVAGRAVQDMEERYPGYRVELVREFMLTLTTIYTEPNTQKRISEVEAILCDLARKAMDKADEISHAVEKSGP